MYTESMGPLFQGGIWTTPLASNAPIDAESPALVSILDQWFPGPAGNHANFSVHSGIYLYIATASTPLVKVTLDPGAPYQQPLQQAVNQVPFPSYAQPSPDTDQRMAIFQPSSACEWEFWHLHIASDGTWHASWGGRTCNARTDPGYYRNVQDTALNILEQSKWGAPSSGANEVGGVIMVDELAHGTIPHAIAFALDNRSSCKTYFDKPFQRTDGSASPILDANGEPTNCVPEGAQFRLPPPCPSGTPSKMGVCFNLSDLATDPPIIREMAAAAQTYGMITTNSTIGGTVYVESGDAQSPPYLVLGGDPYTQALPGARNSPFFGTYYNMAALALFPWKWLELVKLNLTTQPDSTTYIESDPLAPIWPG